MADKVHPVIEAMARAMCEDWGDEWETPTEKGLSVEAHQFYYLELAKAAAKVLLSAEPTPAMLDSGVAFALNVTPISAGGYSDYSRAIYRAMTAALRSEMGIE